MQFKHLTLPLACGLLLSSCGSNNGSSSSKSDQKPKEEKTLDTPKMTLDEYLKAYDNWNVRFNPAVAKLFARTFIESNPNGAKAYMSEYEEKYDIDYEAQKYIEDYNRIKSNYIYGNTGWVRSFLSEKAINGENADSEFLSLEEQLLIENASSQRSQLLDQINQAYQDALSKKYKKLASVAIKELGDKTKDLEKTAKNENIPEKTKIKNIESQIKQLKQLDKILKETGLDPGDQIIAIIYGGIAMELYEALRLDEAKEELMKIVTAAKEAEKVVQSMIPILQSIDESRQRLVTSHEKFHEAQDGLKKDIKAAAKEMQNRINKLNKNPAKIEAKDIKETHDRVYKALKKSLVDGKPLTPSEKGTLLSKGFKINENFQTMVDSYSSMSTEFLTMVEGTRALVGLSGLDLPDNILKLVDDVQKVHETVDTANKVFQGFQNGGVIGAMSALTSSPAMSMLVGKSITPPTPDQIINGKLDKLLAMQQQLLEMQIETMKMIKDLANLVAELHEKEMAAIAELRELALVNIDLAYHNAIENLAHCETLAADLSDNAFKLDFKKSSHSYQVLQTYVYNRYEKLSSLEEIKLIFAYSRDQRYFGCLNHLTNNLSAKRGNRFDSAGILAEFADTARDKSNYSRLQNRIYQPLLEKLTNFQIPSSGINTGLHLPVKSTFDIGQKINFSKTVNSPVNQGFNEYVLTDLFSSKALERYIIQVLRHNELFDFGISYYNEDITIFDIYENTIQINQKPELEQELSLSSQMVLRSAIVQESLLSGEPLLPNISNEFAGLKNSFKDCSYSTQTTNSFACAVFFNQLLVKNFMIYRLMNANPDSYQAALNSKNLSQLAQLLGAGITEDDIKEKDGKIVLHLVGKDQKANIELPTKEMVTGGLIQYSSNMKRLINLQELVVNSLVERNKLSMYKTDSREYLKYRILREQWFKTITKVEN